MRTSLQPLPHVSSADIVRRGTISLSRITAFMIWATFLMMIAAPPLSLPHLPAEIRVYDLGAALALVLGLALAFKGLLTTSPLRSPLFQAFSVYVGLVLLLPLLGLLLLQQAQLWMYFGDLRWVYIFFLVVVASSIYRRQRQGLVEHDVAVFWVAAVLVTWLVLVPQIIFQIAGGAVPWIVDLWYPEDRSGRSFGFHIFRFAGPFGTISGLATFGVISFIAGLLFVGATRLSLFVTWSGLFFVVASGSRTAMVIAGVFLTIYLLRPRTRVSLSAATLLRFVAILVGLVTTFWVATTFGVGRVSSGDGRLASIFAWLRGDARLVEIAGRGGDRWSLPIIESQTWSPVGTLMNASHALDLPAFDSYYVLMWAQAGPILALGFLGFILIALWSALRNYRSNKGFANSLALAVVIVLPIYGLTQNTMTGLLGRVLLAVAVVCLLTTGRKPGADLRRRVTD
ncbi:MAG: hypothetical protein JJU27_15605 [Gammaproteobacteria bacterium]|nr:hypothetical protein [Gammaproteobacteria bacterium]